MDIYEQIQEIYAKKHKAKTTTRKCIGDFMLSEHHAVNVKSNNEDKNNYSPNMISASRLLNWLADDKNELSFIFVNYKVNPSGGFTILNDSGLVPIEHLSWDCLTIQAQGKGVIQMSGDLTIDKGQDRKTFLIGFKHACGVYIKRERAKLDNMEKRIEAIK